MRSEMDVSGVRWRPVASNDPNILNPGLGSSDRGLASVGWLPVWVGSGRASLCAGVSERPVAGNASDVPGDGPSCCASHMYPKTC